MCADRSGECDLCGRDLPASPVETETGDSLCCTGCRDVRATLGPGENEDARIDTGDDERRRDGRTRGDGRRSEEGAVRLFLRIDGMHSVTCEAFLESVAEGREGVVDAEASYVTETIRVDHDPDRISKADLRDALSTLGYTAYLRDDASGADRNSTGTTRQSREMGGIRKRRSEEILGMRYAAGVLFGAFLLLPYVALLYPAHLASLYSGGILQQFEGLLDLGGSGGLYFLRVYFVLTGIVLFFTGMPVLRGAYISLKMRRPNTDLLVSITVLSSYIYGTSAVLLGHNDVFFDLTLVVAAVVTAAVFYESSIKQRALGRLTELTVSQVDTAHVYEADGTTTDVPIEDVEPDDRILVRQGERIPIDGVLADGECTVDEAVVTGESLPVLKRPGDDIVGGSIVTDGGAIVRIGDRATSSIDRLTTAVWNLQSADHGVQRRADRLASRVIAPLVGAAGLAGVASASLGATLPTALLVFLTVLLVGCPWALGLATPLSVATSLEEAVERGIVVFDETVFERLRDIDVVVFDKTGTLTTGEMDVIEADAPPDLLEAAGELERRASHPAAQAIVTAFARETEPGDIARSDGGVIDERDRERTDRVSDFRSHATGVEGTVDGTAVLVGDRDLFAERDWTVSDDIERRVTEARGFGRLPVIVGRDGVAEGIVVVGDEPRDGWDETVTRLSERGTDVVVLTGDEEEATDFFGRHPHVTHVFAGVPPEGKTATIRLLGSDDRIAMVGDGTNDAPALAVADLGISLGSGTALAADAADIAIVDDDLGSVETAFDIANAARQRIRQNNGLALSYNAIAVPAAVAGLLNPLIAILAVVTSCGLIGANCSRDLIT